MEGLAREPARAAATNFVGFFFFVPNGAADQQNGRGCNSHMEYNNIS